MEAATRATPGTAHPPPHHPPAGPVGEPTRTASSAPQRHHPAHPAPTQAHPSTNPTPAPPMAPAPYSPTPAPPTADVVAPAGGTPSGVDGVCGTGCAGVTGTPPAALAPAAKLRPNSPPTADDIARAEACCTAAGFAALPAEPASPLAELARRITPTQQPRQRPHPATGRTTQRRTTPTTRRRQRRHLRQRRPPRLDGGLTRHVGRLVRGRDGPRGPSSAAARCMPPGITVRLAWPRPGSEDVASVPCLLLWGPRPGACPPSRTLPPPWPGGASLNSLPSMAVSSVTKVRSSPE